jgi:hypothetical protein
MGSEKDHGLHHTESLQVNEKADIEHDLTVDPEYRKKERKIVRKLDMTLMPVVWILYLFNYLGRLSSLHRHFQRST